ncbi:MAG: tRNA pseudouridine(38-40) synthase TruA [Eubacterium sp.]|nr:tRNA pseudouridine(38-40) synthase TruA [Eubacterium sp.]
MNYRMVIQYDGSRYKGWQRQKGKDKKDTIQGRIEQVLTKQCGREIEIQGAGRTDAGVHAKGQVASFFTDQTLTLEEVNYYLPEDIRILSLREAGPRFHARLNARGKVYEYRLLKKGHYNVFLRRYAWQMKEDLDLDLMREASQIFLGSHDFAGYCTRASKKKSTVRRVEDIQVIESEGEILLRFRGNGFLYNMVRILTGTLVDVASGKMSLDQAREALEEGERSLAGDTAPAQGLTLVEVLYD